MQELLEAKIQQAKRGRSFWLQTFGDDFEVKTDQYILLLTDEGSINDYLLNLLPEFLSSKKSKHVTILFEKDNIEASVKAYEKKWTNHDFQVRTIKITEHEIKDILEFYCLYQFTGRFIVGSLDFPEGRTGKTLLQEGFTLEEMVKHYIYDLREE